MTVSPIAFDREILVRATASTVFRYFTDPDRFAAWFGAGSSIDARPGGAVRVVFPGGAEAHGEVLEVEHEARVRFTWGYPGDDSVLAPGASTVEVTLAPHADGTLVRLTHVVPSDEVRLAHVAGWRHHLSHLATLAARDQHSDAAATADAWCALWNGDGHASVCDDAVVMDDDLATVSGIDDLVGHIANARAHMPGVEVRRDGPSRIVGDAVHWRWAMSVRGVGTVGRGSSVARCSLDGRIRAVTSFWDDDPGHVSRRVHGIAPPLGDDADADAPVEPHLWATDLRAAVGWYRDVLGFEESERHPADGEATWYRLTRGRAALMVAAMPDPEKNLPNQAYVLGVAGRVSHGGPLALYLQVQDVDAVWASAAAAGADVLEEIWDPWWGGRQFTVAGPDGVWWSVVGKPR